MHSIDTWNNFGFNATRIGRKPNLIESANVNLVFLSSRRFVIKVSRIQTIEPHDSGNIQKILII